MRRMEKTRERRHHNLPAHLEGALLNLSQRRCRGIMVDKCMNCGDASNLPTCRIIPRALATICLASSCILFLATKYHVLRKSSIDLSRRRLDWTSNCKPDIIASLPYPTKPEIPFLKSPSYLASFPGSGDKLFSKHLVEMISGLEVAEAAVSPSLYKLKELGGNPGEYGGQGEVFGVRTHFPHTSGKLASWDNEIPYTIVFLRNPIHAIPSYFNEVYELRNHLPPGSSKDSQHKADTHDTWIKWRDNQFPSQMMLYRRFVSFWMERHIEDDNHRIFFTYESLVEWYKGPEDSKRLYDFIERAIKDNIVEMVKSGGVDGVTFEDKDVINTLINDATKSLVKRDDAPCIWKELVAPATQITNRRLQSVDPPYSSSSGGEWDPIERPLTADNLAALSQMLLELMNRWSRHQRLLNIMAEYHRDVNKLYLEVAKKEDQKPVQPLRDVGEDIVEDELLQPSPDKSKILPQSDPKMNKNFHIIQASPTHTASTIAMNWLMGLFTPFSDYAFMTGNWPEAPIQQSGKEVNIEAHVVTKTHDLEILKMYKKMRPLFDEVFFVISYQQSDLGTTVNEELCQYKNVLCVLYDELVFSSQDELKEMVARLTAKLKTRFAYFFGTDEWLTERDESNCFRRLQDMTIAKLDMENQPKDAVDMRFGVHGGGKKKCPPSLVTC